MSEAPSQSKSEPAVVEPHHGTGHRSRLRKRLAEGGPDALLDHEIIEYLLALAIPRRDVKPLAKQLITRFDSLGGVLTAEWSELERIEGLGETSVAALKIVQAAALRMLSNDVRKKPVLSSWQALLDYLRLDMAYLSVERVRVLHLNSGNMLLRDDNMGEGSIDEAAIYAREVAKRVLQYGSASVILVHNHPSGVPEPSRQDIAITKQIIEALKPLGVAVHDHVIIGAQGHRSLRALGLLS